MLSKQDKDTIQSLYRELLAGLDLKPRYGQRLMIAEIAKSLGAIRKDDEGKRDNNAGIAVVEAGTGTGKTLAYLLASLPLAIAQEKKLVVSTATIALQEQILDKDLPSLQQHISLPFNYALAKGRGRYLCLVKLDKALQQLSGMLSSIDLFEQTPEEKDRQLYEDMLGQFASGQWDGDRDRWDDEIEASQWQHLTATHRECSNRRCPQFQNCAFFKAREAMDNADIIVVNHDLVLADLSLGGGAVLPAPDNTVYVFDEGHHLADKALNHFRMDFGIRSSRQWLKQLERAMEQFVAASGMPASIAYDLQQIPGYISVLSQNMSLLWPLAIDLMGDQDRRRFEFGQTPESLRDLLSELKAPVQGILQGLDKLNDVLQKSLDPKVDGDVAQDVAEQWQAATGLLLARSEQWSLA